jgi:hypothetical protein
MTGPIDIAELRRKHARGRDAIRKAVEEAATEASGDAVTYSRQKHEYKNRTGALRGATFGRVVRLKSGAKVVLKNPKPYAAAIDMGAKPHWIKPRALDKPLRFKVGGRWVSTWLVNHPGNRAYRFLYNATRHGHRMLLKRLEARLAGVARKF